MAAEALLEGVRPVLENWDAYCACLGHCCDGPDRDEKARWMPGAVSDWLISNRDVAPDELEDVLSVMMDDVFDAVVGDGSLREISQQICTIQHLSEAGQVHKVYSIIAESKKPEAGAQRRGQVVSEPAQGTVSSSFAAMDLGDEGTDAPAERSSLC